MTNIVQRFYKRQAMNIFFLALFVSAIFVLGIFVGKAYADEAEKPQKKTVTSINTIDQERRLRAKQATTTTTTTQPRSKVGVKPTSPDQAKVSVATTPIITGDWVSQCNIWLAEAGIPLEDHAKAIYLIDRESDCNPTVRNPNSSAGGIPQALPWTKMGCPLEHSNEAAICQLRWMQSYVTGRYGSWSGAVAHSKAKGWY